MLIAQMSDIHIGFAPAGEGEERNVVRFRAALDHLLASPNVPDMLVLSGDVTERGDLASLEKTRALLAGCPFPVWPMVGNHDARDTFVRAFPQVEAAEGGFVHYALEQGGLRLLLLDTIEPGRAGGAFCAARQAWLAARLAEAPDTPTAIVMHHPPVVSGIDWMDPDPADPWVRRFGAAIAGHAQVRAIHCGHLHRAVATSFEGIPLHVAPSVAPPLALDLRPADPAHPDGRALITEAPPGYALHHWDGTRLATHYTQACDWPVMARYTEETQPMIREMAAERGR